MDHLRIHKGINAAINAVDFGGGIHSVGSNSRQAAFVMDGDPATGWSPDPNDSPEDWFIEIDLGRAVAARKVTLIFDEEAPPFELFTLLLSTGEQAIDVVDNIIDGSLIYRFQERFKGNKRHRVTQDLDLAKQPPVQFLRVESLLHVPGARLVEVEVEETGEGFQVKFPRPIRQRELVELRFTSAVFLQATRFDVFLWNCTWREMPEWRRCDGGCRWFTKATC